MRTLLLCRRISSPEYVSENEYEQKDAGNGEYAIGNLYPEHFNSIWQDPEQAESEQGNTSGKYCADDKKSHDDLNDPRRKRIVSCIFQ